MIDTHVHPHIANWGIRPTLFSLGDFSIPSYTFFVLLGLVVGVVFIYIYTQNAKQKSEYLFELVLAGILGGIVGAKIPIWIYYVPQVIRQGQFHWEALLAGRTILGGLIGGVVAIWLVKKKLHITTRLGNHLVPGIIVGIAIGRIGCFLRGCCYGIPTKAPWGVDFGDGVARHPTQLYEILFLGILFFFVHKRLQKNPRAGVVFDFFIVAYFSYRFIIEFIRVEPRIFLHLTLFQWIALAVLLYIFLVKKRLLKRV